MGLLQPGVNGVPGFGRVAIANKKYLIPEMSVRATSQSKVPAVFMELDKEARKHLNLEPVENGDLCAGSQSVVIALKEGKGEDPGHGLGDLSVASTDLDKNARKRLLPVEHPVHGAATAVVLAITEGKGEDLVESPTSSTNSKPPKVDTVVVDKEFVWRAP